jgi:hypothetical protein
MPTRIRYRYYFLSHFVSLDPGWNNVKADVWKYSELGGRKPDLLAQ